MSNQASPSTPKIIKLSLWMLLAILAVTGGAYGVSYYLQKKEIKAQHEESSGEFQKNLFQAVQKSKNPEDLRKALSDMAWGKKNKAYFEKNKKEAVPNNSIENTSNLSSSRSSNTLKNLSQEELQNMQTLESRMQYCSKNWQNDPSCATPPPK